MENKLANIVGNNILRLAKKHNLNSVSLGLKAGYNQRTAYRLMNPEKSASNPQAKTILKTCNAFKADYWQLVFPDIPVDLVGDKRITRAIQQLADCSPESRTKIFERIEELADLDKIKKRER